MRLPRNSTALRRARFIDSARIWYFLQRSGLEHTAGDIAVEVGIASKETRLALQRLRRMGLVYVTEGHATARRIYWGVAGEHAVEDPS